MKIRVNGRTYEVNGPEDLRIMRTEHYEDWYSVRTSNRQLIYWQLEAYLDELDRQDAEGSTGSYGKRNEVMERVEHALAHSSQILLHDIRCRSQKLDDQRIGDQRIEHKTGFAQWAYGYSEDECWHKLEQMARKGIEMHWEPFCDEYKIIIPLSQLLEYLAQYNPSKGLKVWFSYKMERRQLQIQPVSLSYKRYAWIAKLVKSQNPDYEILSKDEYKGRSEG